MAEKEPSRAERLARKAMWRVLVENRKLPFGINYINLIDRLVQEDPDLEKELPDQTSRLSRIRKEIEKEKGLVKGR